MFRNSLPNACFIRHAPVVNPDGLLLLPIWHSNMRNAFGDDTVFIEKYLEQPRHIEFQIIADKTGYMWTFNDRPGLSTNDRGLNVLMGGIDSRDIVTPTFVPSVGGVFVQERLAMSAGYHVARADLAPGREGDARLLKFVTIEDTPEANPNEFEAQIRELYLQLTGIPLDPEATEPAELMQLWKYQYSIEADPIRAWGSVVTAVLRDPTVVFY